MNYEKRKLKIKEIAKTIITHQFEDTLDYSINNHFLESVINEMVRLQADKIKGFADFIFDYAKTNNVREFDDCHSLECEIMRSTPEMDVLVIFDETIYGPNLENIIVIDDKEHGKFHIRKLNNPTLAVGKYVQNNFKVPGEDFVTEGFIMTYEYESALLKSLMRNPGAKAMSKKELEVFDNLKTTQSMGDNTFHLYECVAYSASLLGSIKRHICEELNQK
jgi:hypothetical protein